MKPLNWKILGHDDCYRSIDCFVCRDTCELQNLVLDMLGYLPCDCTELVVLGDREGDTVWIFIQEGTPLPRLAHEAFHAAMMLRPDANDYTLHRPYEKNPDFGFTPNEVAACLCEEIFSRMLASLRTIRRKEV